MGRPKLGAEYKKPSDYTYDYPKNREIAKHLDVQDRIILCQMTGFSKGYINDWCLGRRKNKRIGDMAVRIANLNIEKFRKLKMIISKTSESCN
jgi:hypothetical protein